MGVDIGGTFTDVAVVDECGMLRVGKVLTTPDEEDRGVLAAIEHADTPLDAIELLVHGTTLVINALIERKGADVVLVTTAGFRDIHEMGRGNRPESFNLFYKRDPALVPRHRRLEIGERTLADGAVVVRPSPADLDEIADEIRAIGPAAVAVALLNSYVAPGNEQFVVAELRRRLPGVFLSRSSEISREWREYERFTTTAANAYVGPPTDAYLNRIERGIASRGFSDTFVMLDSNGGALTPQTARLLPVRLVESGPVGGAIGAAVLAGKAGLDTVVTFDIGGTTAKSTLIESGEYPSNDLYWVGGYERGFPLQMSCIDIVEIGAGGGSIAWIDGAGRLRVGPLSAGARPGPACYGNGGVDPTVTDANVYLGRLPPDFFIGSLSISPLLAAEAIEGLAAKLEMEPMRLALGVVTLAELSMAEIVRHQTVSRGRDPRNLTLVAFGGAGPLHACAVAAEVGISAVLVPPAPGHFSAIGMLSANVRFDRREVFQCALRDLDEALLGQRLRATAEELIPFLPEELQQDRSLLRVHFSLALRYRGQENTLLVGNERDGLTVEQNAGTRFAERFEAEHLRRYGYAPSGNEVEVVEYVVLAERETAPINIESAPVTSGADGRTQVQFTLDEPAAEISIIPRSSVAVGETVAGPLLIYEDGSTTVVPPKATVTATPDRSILIDLGGYTPTDPEA